MEHNLSWKRMKERLTSRRGMTLMELMIVVAIVAILGGVSFIAVWNYQRSLAQVERDGIAKEIFVAAQNHLTAAQGQGYLGKTRCGTLGNYTETVTKDGEEVPVSDSDNKVYYYTVTNGKAFGGGEDAFNLMLPFGSIDETIRAGGSYLIRYQPETATVLDVFYCSTNGSPTKFNHSLQTTEYGTVMGLRNDKNGRKNYAAGNDSVLGYYGGAEADTLATLKLKAPTIKVENGDKLKVTVTDTNSGQNGALLQLIVEGVSSGAKKAYGLPSTDDDDRITFSNGAYEIILDDITTSGMHFCEIVADTAGEGKKFIPGEDIKVYAVAYSTSALANIAYSAEKTTNSLFASISDSNDADVIPDTAMIGSIRHLENLNGHYLSGQGLSARDKVSIISAEQTSDLSWSDFQKSITGNDNDEVSVYYYYETGWKATQPGGFYPISINAYDPYYDGTMNYDGKGHFISGIKVFKEDSGEGAGLFGRYMKGSISNLELLNFNISGKGCSGALAGQITIDSNVENVLARNSGTEAVATVKSSDGSSGGLVGEFEKGNMKNCVAALVVEGKTNVGGLIGKCGANATVIGCYSGGHTNQGEYYAHDLSGNRGDPIYNVISENGSAGGLIGDAGTATISCSYSTCSVYGAADGAAVGGFVGKASGKITKSYCTGLVNGENNAFIGSGPLADNSTDNLYYKIVNEKITFSGTGAEKTITAISYKDPGRDGITPIEDNFNVFVGDSSTWTPAKPYDITLASNYGGLFNLKTVEELGASVKTTDFVKTHYGDWPSPELFYTNTPA